jgi:DNA topoisomerase-1
MPRRRSVEAEPAPVAAVQGGLVRDPATLRRIRALAIPPAWTQVWICPDPDRHVQATGRDRKGRKQCRYHPRWRAVRDAAKYGHMLELAHALPGTRARVEADMRLLGLPRERVLATMVHLPETALIRIGNDACAARNGSYGLTMLRARAEGVVRDVTSGDVNAYLREIPGHDITAKDFRTWAGTVLAAMALREFGAADSQTAARRNITAAVEERVAARLGNTPGICRQCYIHPQVFDAYPKGDLLRQMKEEALTELRGGMARLCPEEAMVLALLLRRLRR